jgi:hypothetical protein
MAVRGAVRLWARGTWPLVLDACRSAGLDPAGAEPVRIADNAIWSIPG